jgi:hypothetical protein
MTKITKGADKKPHDDIGKKSQKNKFIVIGLVAAVVATIAFVSYKLDNPIDNGFSLVDGIPCETTEFTTYHIHAHLDIFVNGQSLTVPQSIGIEDNTCLYWLHTHKTDGIIHIESPQPRDFSLGQFFDIWKSTKTGMPPSDEPLIYVNGNVVTTKLKDTPLNAHDEIVLVYRNPPSNIPTFYQFPEGE